MSKSPSRNRPAAAPRRTAVPPRKEVAARRANPTSRRRPPRRQRHWARWSIAAAVVAAGAAAAVVATTGGSSKSRATEALAIGAQAPDGAFSTVSGQTETIASLRGRPTLLWFVATWCSSCQAGTQAMATAIDTFDRDHLRVVELEQYNDLGQSGPPIAQFGQQLAGTYYNNPNWTWGTASEALTTTYNPKGYLDIYYLLSSSGKIVDIGSSPAATMNQLLSEASTLGSSSASAQTSLAAAHLTVNVLCARAVPGGLGLALRACGAPGGSAGAATKPSTQVAATAAPFFANAPRRRLSLTLLDGATTTLSSFRGSPVMVWFVADGCASCAVSIPAVGEELSTFARAHVRILVLGIYGAFGSGTQGLRLLGEWGEAAAGPAFKSPVWTWAMASEQLTAAYDPLGIPDAYFLLDKAGHVVYHSSVPVSTMGSLLAHLHRLTGVPIGHVARPPSGPIALP